MTILTQSEPRSGQRTSRRLARAEREPARTAPRAAGSATSTSLPFFLVFAAFSIYPWIDTAWVSLHDVRLSTYDQSSWIGLENYRNLFTNHVLLERVQEHDHDRDHLDRPAAVHGARHRPPAELPPARAHVLPGRDADAVRDQPRRRDGDLRRAVRPEARAHQLVRCTSLHLPAVDWQGSKWPSQIAVSTIVTWRWTGYNALIYLAGMQAIGSDALRGRRDRRRGRAGRSSATSRCRGCGRRSCSRSWCRRSGRPSSSASRCSTTTACPTAARQNQYQTLGLLMYQQGWTNDRLGLASATAWTMFLIIVAAVAVNLGLARRRMRRQGAGERRGAGRPKLVAAP